MKHLTTLFTDHTIQTVVKTIHADPTQTEREKALVNLYPQVGYQTIDGFGGAFTDAAGYVFSLLSSEQQQKVLTDFFSADGLGYTIGRTSLDSCDFSLECYTSGAVADDLNLTHFDISRAEQYVMPLLRRAQETAGRSIPLMLTPWSPPAWMKTNGSRVGGGKLKQAYYGLWAEYICKYIRQMMEDGADVQMLSPQNEPKAVQTWDSCLFSAKEEQMFIQQHLYPALRRNGLEHIQLLIWDHNKERAFERACETICNEEMEQMVAGVAVHWYSGDHFEALDMIRQRFPGKKLVFSEACVEYSILADQSQLVNAQMYAHEIIGDLNHGLTSFLDWNLLLDEQGGPNHVGNYCDAPMMYNRQTGVLTRNLSYDYIGHFSRYIKPGAVRIGLSRFSPQLEVTAAQNPDGSICTVVLNPGQQDISFFLRIGSQVWPLTQPAESIGTCLLSPSECHP